MQRAHIPIIMALLAMSAVSGCRREIVVVLGTPPEDTIGIDPAPAPPPGLIPAAQAKTAPVLELKTFIGQPHRVQPGLGSKVTLVMFWSMRVPHSKAAARHVGDLANHYAAQGAEVEALGVLEGEDWERALGAMRLAKIDYLTYVDDGSAQEAMARAAGKKYEKVVPWVFIVDAEGRVRYSRQGFYYSQSVGPTPSGQKETVTETAPAGERIEDYLLLVLMGR